MVLVIFCDDHKGEVDKTIGRLGGIGVPVTGEHVDYKMSTGAVRGVPDIVTEVCGHVYKSGVRTVFLVDLSPDETVNSKEHGLNVIAGLQKELSPGGTTVDFLKSKNFLTVVVTVHALDASDLAKAWKVKLGEVEIVRLSDGAAISRIVSEHSTKAILAFVAKRIDEPRIPPLVAQWSKAAGERGNGFHALGQASWPRVPLFVVGEVAEIVPQLAAVGAELLENSISPDRPALTGKA